MPRNKRLVNLRTQGTRSFDDSYAYCRMYRVQVTKRKNNKWEKHAEAWWQRWNVEPTRNGLSTPRRTFGKPLLHRGKKP